MNLTVISQNNLKITVGWTPPAGVVGYRFRRDGEAISSSFDAAKSQVTFGIPDSKPHTFAVDALSRLDTGSVSVNTPVPPTTVSNSLKPGATLFGVYQWKVATAGDCAKVEFWADKTKMGEAAGVSPYTFSLDTSKLTVGDHLFGVVEVDHMGVRYPDQNRVTAKVVRLRTVITGTPAVGKNLTAAIA